MTNKPLFLLDGWLLHSHPTCPVDGQLVWSVEMEAEQKELKRYFICSGEVSLHSV